MAVGRGASFNFEKLKILLVDDNDHIRRMVSTIVMGAGIRQIYHASDGGAALDMVERNTPDVTIVDFQMEPVNGIEFTRLVRGFSDPRISHLPIIMMTGHSELRQVMNARNAGVNEFLAKPVTTKAVLSRIEAVISRPRAFVRTASYFGPDRRRRRNPKFTGEDRRRAIAEPAAGTSLPG